jgi:dienelactone hydrolase
MRAAFLFGLVCLVACGSDDEAPFGPSTAGSGGAGDVGGSSASSGSAGAGTGAASSSAGNGGSAGSGGSAIGGEGGGGGFPSPVPDDCITDVSAKADHVYQCSDLAWNASVPGECLTKACGLVFDVHGFTMSGQMQEANTRLAELGAAAGYIVVQPNADPAPPSAGWAAAEDDPKVLDFIQRVMAAFHTDPKRLHFTGFSQGGDMSWRFLCDHADIIASAAPSAFGQSADEDCFSKGVAPSREIPILYMHGTSDNLVSFSNAEAARDAVIDVWGLAEESVVSSDADHVWTRYTNATGAVFELLQHDYTGVAILGSHCYPGSTDPGGAPGQLFSFKCDPPNAFDWGEAALAFFQAHPLP